MTVRSYAEFFKLATANDPYPYQQRLGEADRWPSVAEIPTGLGKTEASIIAWLWRLLERGDAPRRLIYVLPLRALVEQTVARVDLWLRRLTAAEYAVPVVYKLLGGEIASEWVALPDRPQIIVGTQDLLLSRALNRGYAISRRKWPMAFGLLHNDCLWIVDEVQLQGIGAVTAAQLQGLREKFGCFGQTATMFVSATVDRQWVDTVDHRLVGRTSLELDDDDRAVPSILRIIHAEKKLNRIDPYEPSELAQFILNEHSPGTRTMVVVNRVSRAVDIFQSMLRREPKPKIVLLHSRFRAKDRENHLKEAIEDPPAEGTIVVATQVVEAGLDLSSKLLVSDLAPWPSMVQRFGRCNRRGDDAGRVLWCEPTVLDKKNARPYDAEELERCRKILADLEGKSAAPHALPQLDRMPFPRGPILRKAFVVDLFDTSPDLSGGDLDVAPFIRPDDQFTVSVLWREEQPSAEIPPRPEELCPAPRQDVEKLITRRLRRGDAMVVDPLSRGGWRPAQSRLRNGELVWLHGSLGGYRCDIGFDLRSTGAVAAVPVQPVPPEVREGDDVYDDAVSMDKVAVTLEVHSSDASREASRITGALASLLADRFDKAIVTAARWHDLGKVHPVFQDTMARAGCPVDGGPWAKAPGRGYHKRPCFRHELVSALGWLAANATHDDRDLVAYLVAAHHGIIRQSIYHLGREDGETSILGVESGEKINATSLGGGVSSTDFDADLRLFNVGATVADGSVVEPTWSDRVAALCLAADVGLFRLAYLELLVRVADWRASASPSVPAAPIEARASK